MRSGAALEMRPARRAREPRRAQPLEDGEELRELAALGDLWLQPPASRRMLRAVTDSVVPSTRYDPTTTSAAPTSCPTLMMVARLSAAGHGQVELLERAHALRSGDRAGAAGAQAVGQEDGGRLAQPVKARLVTRVLERHDEHPRRRSAG